ncbi:uncharacterized protein LOC131224925 [Magnolia sinica]|uniref:uncharacterized protein LOC131224925 n=1 Tax=Magnolia sinica TaxID=86752 RepID=UPI00265B6758|nr:uncharacterized protein LOC131224925 [Magnolia sinica]
MIQSGQEAGILGGIRMRGTSTPISRIQYTDDTLIFSEADPVKVGNLRTTIHCFEAMSGLRINLAKSKMFGVNLKEEEVSVFANSFGCSSISLLVSFVGLPLCLGLPPKSLWDKVINRFKSYLAKWKCRYLSLGGRLTLIKFKEGGAGIKDLKRMNMALLGKWIWRLGTEDDSLWNKIIKGKYSRSIGGWWTKDSSRCRASALWKGILSLKKDVLKGIGFVLGKRDNIRFWEDIWVGDVPLKDDFPNIFRLASNLAIHVANCFSISANKIEWNVAYRRNLHDWEVEEYVGLLEHIYRGMPDIHSPDKLYWKADKSSKFS